MTDDQTADFYADPANREVVGPGRKRNGQGRLLSNHVPVRFSPSMIARIRTVAGIDGLTVSSWIRSVIEQEVERRLPQKFETGSSAQPAGPFGQTISQTVNSFEPHAAPTG
jgi:hypothetical protein